MFTQRFWPTLIVGMLLALAGCRAGSSGVDVVDATPQSVATTISVLPASVTVAPTRPVTMPTETMTVPTATPEPPQTRFAIIGDFGMAGPMAEAVANLVTSWQPDFIVTTGDNNYPSGAAETIDANIGQYYHEFIYPYQGEYGDGAEQNRFFPILGNHDLDIAGGQAYFDYFELPGDEHYYTIEWLPVEIFALNSMPGEPDGITADSAQAEWLAAQLAASTACWKLVFYHHAAYSSGHRGASEWMRWPFQEWGADATFAGHNHVYERVMLDDFPAITNGLGGGPRYAFADTPDPDSVVRYNADHGAMLVDVVGGQLTFQFVTHTGEVIDTYTLEKECR